MLIWWFRLQVLETGGKPSTRLPPGKLVEHFAFINPDVVSSLLPQASNLQPSASSLSLQPAALSPQPPALHAPPRSQKTTKLDRKMPQFASRYPGLFQSSQATVLELWPSPALLKPPLTQLDTSWSNQETPQTHRKRPHLTGKCLKQKVVIQASSRALRPPFWSSGLPLTS